ncbi:heme NO-binding domain-containing protein [Shewanella surugensis]|uniref:Heme NO-binding domain-containing protein n=1 Tax=Shewanella surugensis TaxID=212020 RepID=A0ABT0LL16_9GAMM|nr:heme NO-binding domain-containing protein [Shewanella surugensis]MCL1127992.1 heme NO-binding domain-containing protein [Shewanella surugensis]
MTGIIFIEFINIVNINFGNDICHTMTKKAKDNAKFIKNRNYSHHRLLKLVNALSELTRISVEDLLELMGREVFLPFLTSLPIKIEDIDIDSTIDFVIYLETYIHGEAKKLYPKAKVPTIVIVFVSSNKLIMDYFSPRCMGHVCLGLLKGCAKYFNEDIVVKMLLMDESGAHVRFTLTKMKVD